MHRPDRLFDRSRFVGTVAEVKVQVVDTKAFERLVAGLDYVLAVQPALGGELASGAKKDLGRHRVAVARPADLAEDAAHHALGLAVGVDFGVVKKVDPGVVGRHEQVFGGGVGDLVAEGDPGSEG